MSESSQGPVDHGWPVGTRVRLKEVRTGRTSGTGVVVEDRDKSLGQFESRYVFPIAVQDDHGFLFHYQPQDIEEEPAVRDHDGLCEWYAICDYNATTTRPHPVLGDVPICSRCNERVGKIGKG